jgi:type II secretory pathway pseudopilin PulG
MIKNSSKQTGSAHVVIIVILVIALLGTLGFVFWQNFINKDSATQDSTTNTQSAEDGLDSTAKTSVYTFDNAVTGINKTLLKKGCNGSGVSNALATDAFQEVDDSAQYTYQGGMSKINTGLSYAFVQYGCGSQGSVALLKKTNDEWILVSEDARIYPMCASIRGQGFTISIIDKCYIDDQATEPVAI